MTRRSGRQRKPRDVSPDQTLTPSKRTSRLSTQRKKDDAESESETEEVAVDAKTPRKRVCMSKKLEGSLKEVEEKSEKDESEEEVTKSSNGVTPSSHRRSRHSSKSEDQSETEVKSRSGRKRKGKEETERIEEEKSEDEEKTHDQVDTEEVEKEEEEEANVQQVKASEVAQEDGEAKARSESEKEESDKDSEEEKGESKEEGEERREQSSNEEEQEEEEEEAEARRSASVAQEKEQEEEEEGNAAVAEEEDNAEVAEDDGDKESAEEEEQQDAADREEGEIEGSPPPMWTGELRTWGVCKSYSKHKFLRVRDVNISTSVLRDLNTIVKPLSRDILSTSTQETPPVYSSEEEEEEEEPEVAQEAMDTSERDGADQEEEEETKMKDENENPNVKKRERKSSELDKEDEDRKSKSTVVRKVSIKKDRDSPRRSKPSLTPTNVLYIYNLTRPFTLGQLRELLSRTGKIVQDGFWIDAIKSKCYVEYEKADQAEETRHALHEVRWPVTNDKLLKVEFTTKDAMLAAQIKAETLEQPIHRKTDPLVMDRTSQRTAVREWDMGKTVEAEDRSRDRDRRDKDGKERESKRSKERRYSPSGDRGEPESRRRKRDVEAPAKLLDDLFKKTKTLPCLYWLPLTAEQIAVKEEMRKKHLAELEKRIKGNTSKLSRDRRGRRS